MKVFLRALEPEDFISLVKWRNDPEITNLMGGNVHFVSSAREKKWIEDELFNDKNNIKLAICIKENKKHIGNANLSSIEWINRKAEFSIFIGEKEEWGKGYGKEATLLLLEYGFEQLNLNKIFLAVNTINERAIKMYSKLGFKKEGELREDFFKNNRYYNHMIMSILKDEYQKIKSINGI